jgi:hypothetical protein
MERNFLKTGRGRQQLMSGIPASFWWILSTLLAVVAVPFSCPSGPGPLETKPAPVEAGQPQVTVVNVETRVTAEGRDSHQRSLPFTVYVLAQQLSWKLESATDLEGGNTILSPELTTAVSSARDVFCVGTASFEGATRAEEARAAERAATLAHWVGTIIRDPRQTRVFALNAGQYRGPKELDSAYQRKAILIVTGPHDDAVNLSEGLTSGLKRQQQAFPVVYSLLHDYSRSKEWAQLANPPGEAAGRRDRHDNRRRMAASRVRR